MAEDVKKLRNASKAADTPDNRRAIVREYVAYRLLACYHGSRAAFGKADATWKRFIAEIGTTTAKQMSAQHIFVDTNDLGRLVDERGIEYQVAIKDSPRGEGGAGKALFTLASSFCNHVNVHDIAQVAYWGGIWVDWSIADKTFVEKILRAHRIGD